MRQTDSNVALTLDIKTRRMVYRVQALLGGKSAIIQAQLVDGDLFLTLEHRAPGMVYRIESQWTGELDCIGYKVTDHRVTGSDRPKAAPQVKVIPPAPVPEPEP